MSNFFIINKDQIKFESDFLLRNYREKKIDYCINENCKLLASYNYKDNGLFKYYCHTHKLNNMINMWECRNCKLKVKFKKK